MDPDVDINPDKDDLPLRANTNHILVRHYVLDLTVHFDREVISGCVVLFLEPCSGVRTKTEDHIAPARDTKDGTDEARGSQDRLVGGREGRISMKQKMFVASERGKEEPEPGLQTAAETKNPQSSHLWELTSDGEFTVVLDCCDLDISKVEEVDVTLVSAMSGLLPEAAFGVTSVAQQTAFIQEIISMPSVRWRQKHQLYLLCSRAPGAQDTTSLHFHQDQWSLQVRKKGTASSQDFPRAVRIWYETRPTGGSVRWTKDQDGRFVSRCKMHENMLAAHLLGFLAPQCNILSLLCYNQIIPIH